MNSEDNNRQTTFIFMGDPQCSRLSGNKADYSEWEKLLRLSLDKAGSDGAAPLVVLGGDIVNRRGSAEEWNAFFETIDRVRADRDFIMASPTGVHGGQKPYYDVPGFSDRFILPENGPFGHENGFFSFDYGCAHFMILDSNYMDNTDEEACKYLGAWIKHDLATNRKPAAFAVMHHPMYSVGHSIDDGLHAKAMQDGFQRLLYRYGIDMILCGHQHLYCRTCEETQITQLMGVSGSKHFDAKNTEKLAVLAENVVVTTITATNGYKIEGETFDIDGNSIDSFSQDVRPPKPRKCGSCPNFDTCKGTGIIEKNEAEETAKANGRSPLIPAPISGIIVDGTTYSHEDLAKLDWRQHFFSVIRRGEMRQETAFGFELADIIKTKAEDDPVGTLVTIVNEDGKRRRFLLSDLLKADAVIYKDETDTDDTHLSKYRLAMDQVDLKLYGGGQWISNIVEIKTDRS